MNEQIFNMTLPKIEMGSPIVQLICNKIRFRQVFVTCSI